MLEPFVPFWAQTSALFVGWVSAWPMWTDPTQRSGPTQHSDLDRPNTAIWTDPTQRSGPISDQRRTQRPQLSDSPPKPNPTTDCVRLPPRDGPVSDASPGATRAIGHPSRNSRASPAEASMHTDVTTRRGRGRGWPDCSAFTRLSDLFKQTPFDADDELSVVIKLSL